MREILYRAISLCKGEHWLYGQPRHYARNPHTEKWTIYDPKTGIETDIVPETLGQYTGLKDKQGKKVFEGDIVSNPNSPTQNKYTIGQVIFSNAGWWRVTQSAWTTIDLAVAIQNGVIIIGNIHDNPEILKGGKDSPAYFSEQAIREAALDMLNTSWADTNYDKAIEFMIEQLKKTRQESR